MAWPRTWLLTGGAGFIGANFARAQVALGTRVINLDALTYAGNPASLAGLLGSDAHVFVHGDIRDAALVTTLLEAYRPDALIHLAAESHVDRSILEPATFIETNVLGTQVLLAATTEWWRRQPRPSAEHFRFVHVSTDEVYGSLGPDDPPFTEASPYAPNSPYAASKAASDHLARAYHRTYGLPLIVTHCSNNYGPFQFPEKLIPRMILEAQARRPLPVYGDGLHVRDWLLVDDHCAALDLVTRHGRPGQMYDISGQAARTNLEVVRRLADLVDELAPDGGPPRRELVRFVPDRPGHDRRYAIDDRKLRAELGWAPSGAFEPGLRRTVRWYLEHPEWVATTRGGAGHAPCNSDCAASAQAGTR